MELIHTFEFAAAHQLPYVPEGHKCGRMHGHTYRVELVLEGPVNPMMGWVEDFAGIKTEWLAIHEALDHRTLNDVLPNPTAELLAVWIADHVDLPLLTRVVVWETPHSAAAYDVVQQVPGQERLYD